jgi:hypothetical protein
LRSGVSPKVATAARTAGATARKSLRRIFIGRKWLFGHDGGSALLG